MSYSTNSVSRSELLMSSLEGFFRKADNINKILPIINGSSKISLRVIDWFVTNYSKKNNTSYFINKATNSILKDENNYNPDYCKQFLVYIDYKLQLKGYQKKQFDPFCRRARINFYYETDKFFVTTVGQLNFFRWVINNKILDYICENLKAIETDMNSCYKTQYCSKKKTKNNSKRRKRQELSVSASKSLSKTNVTVVVSFD